jgi:hypothetical protein
MLLPDNLYRRIPQLWMLMGVLFLVLALINGPSFRYFAAYLLLGLISLGRALWINAARQRIARGREVTVLTETQRLERKS